MEFTGHPQAFNEGLDLIRHGGRYLTVGRLGLGATSFMPSLIASNQLKILGSFSGRAKAYWEALNSVSAQKTRCSSSG
jgi:threonine dehydrogenase-like Zn-dependent dehydrogenase